MNARCKTCSTSKDEKKMFCCKFASKNMSGVIMYGGYHYWYFCKESCLNQYQQEQPIEVIRPEESKNRKSSVIIENLEK